MVKKFIETYGLAVICGLAAIIYVSVTEASILVF